MTQPTASFRDPAGSCCQLDGRILRALSAESAALLEGFLQSAVAREFSARKQLVPTRRLSPAELAHPDLAARLQALVGPRSLEAVFEHERLFFPSYPYEWSPEMLWEAGRLTLELAQASLAEGYGLKDATPFNVLFQGAQPVFIDLPSFERRTAGDPVWTPYGQFVRTFLLPLLVHRKWGVKLADTFLTRRDGLEPQEVYPWCGPLERLWPPLLSLVSMPTWLRGKARADGEKLYTSRTLANPEKAQFILESLLKQLQRALQGLKPPAPRDSVWSDYMATHSYSEPAFAAKERFVAEMLAQFQPARVLDVGANTGHFSALAAKAGAAVVAIDLDASCVGGIWHRAHQQQLNILPLTIDLSRPSPALGWQNRETPSFLERASGAFDGVLMLAVIHHLLVTERIPLEQILRLAAQLTRSWVVVEFVAPQDAMFRHLTRGREHLHAGLTEAVFEQACAAHFDIVRSLPLPGTQRRLYGLKRKGGPI